MGVLLRQNSSLKYPGFERISQIAPVFFMGEDRFRDFSLVLKHRQITIGTVKALEFTKQTS